MRRREKLPDFFLGAEALLALGKSSCDWLRPASFCLFFLRKISLVPLRRKPTAGGGGDCEPALLACLAEERQASIMLVGEWFRDPPS